MLNPLRADFILRKYENLCAFSIITWQWDNAGHWKAFFHGNVSNLCLSKKYNPSTCNEDRLEFRLWWCLDIQYGIKLCSLVQLFFLVLLSTCYKLKVERGVYWFHLVRLPLCVSHVMLVSKFKNLKFWQIFKICNFDFVFVWLGIQYYSIVWVIMRQQEYHQNAGILVVLVKETLNHKYV